MLIRYPGSKDKHLKLLHPHLIKAAEQNRTVVEPFAGTASITFHLLANKSIDHYVINDIDPGITALWETVKNHPTALNQLIKNYTPTVDDFYDFKQNPNIDGDVIQTAFRKLALHQISYSGLGGKAGGPLGGAKQQSQYGVDCRWYPDRLQKTVTQCSELLNTAKGTVLNEPWEKVTQEYQDTHFLYLDPPYYVKGGALYLKGVIDHEKLATLLQPTPNWVLSYDDTPEVRNLYQWATVQRLDVRSHLHHKIIGDLLITP